MNDGIIVLQRSAQRMGMRMALLRPDGQGKTFPLPVGSCREKRMCGIKAGQQLPSCGNNESYSCRE